MKNYSGSVLERQTRNSRRSSSDWEGCDVYSASSQSSSSARSTRVRNSAVQEHNSKLDFPNNTMDIGDGLDPSRSHSPSQPKPLQISKQRQQNSPQRSPPKIVYPPRVSSVANRYPNDPEIHYKTVAKVSSLIDIPNSAVSNYPAIFDTFGQDFTSVASGDTQPAAAAYSMDKYISSSDSSGFLGDFIPIASPVTTTKSQAAPRSNLHPNIMPRSRLAVNPYEFDPSSPYIPPYAARQTTMSDFMDNEFPKRTPLNRIPRSPHLKNSHSTGNASFTRKPTPMPLAPQIPQRPLGRSIHRSESSPHLTGQPFPRRQDRSPSPELYERYGRSDSPARGERLEYIRNDPVHNDPILRDAIRKDTILREAVNGDSSRSDYQDLEMDRKYSSRASSSRHNSDHSQSTKSRSPQSPSHHFARQESIGTYASPRSRARSPSKGLDNVPEKDERDSVAFKDYPPTPKRRSRSPMKKMFGERGWLGQSPNEQPGQNLRQNKSRYGEPKKTTLMGKLKNKLEEMAEKADLTPTRTSRSSREKPPKMSVLAVSLLPPQQARIYMEVELMLVHTANAFLMNQFSQGRIAVDTIKKTVDTWKSKGRTVVIEFMYDQATQRELVAANQENLRFHGGTAGSEVRINSMLYNWKQVASIMSIRTFCHPDTIIMKILFDIEQILDLLGAAENIMLRFQQIRGTTNELIRVARHTKEAEDSLPHGRETAWSGHSSSGFQNIKEAMDDPYGGLKLVPDNYVEQT